MQQEQRMGYFTESQLDRMNIKTLANPLTYPWNGHDLLAMLVVITDMAIAEGCPDDEARQGTVDWYCRTPSEGIIEELEKVSRLEVFQQHRRIVEFMHDDPEAFMRMMEKIEQGWSPENDNA